MHKGIQENLRKGGYSDQVYFYHVTFRLEKNRKDLTHEQRRFISRYLESTELTNFWSLLAWVVMPDYVHVLFELTGAKTLSQLIGRIKSKLALELNRGQEIKSSVWQKGFYDHGLRTQESLLETARYIIANPVRANIVKNVRYYTYWNSVWLLVA
ncbi:transposase [Reinekea sp. G2M2-21]|uniref:REP-associated tyrosine transposase n=1 Tax=Reinekea sp. G2M2-21 TaxID=2788942 RepID=UPI0018A9929A